MDIWELESLLIKYNKLFRRYIRNASEREITSCLFAYDGALLAFTRSGAEFTALK